MHQFCPVSTELYLSQCLVFCEMPGAVTLLKEINFY